MVSHDLEFSKGDLQPFLGGYSILEGLNKKNINDYYSWLFEPCGNHAATIRTVNEEQRLGELLDLFMETRFGFAAITDGPLRAMVGLSDMLQLFEDGTLRTDLVSKDVASKPLRVPAGTTLKAAIGRMFEKRVRKLVVDGGSSLVSDREIISFIFSPRQLAKTRKSPKSMLAGSLREVKRLEGESVEDRAPIKDVAHRLLGTEGNTLFCGQGIITPWDAVMKTWAMGHLTLR
jgi:CBS domain-containing protein